MTPAEPQLIAPKRQLRYNSTLLSPLAWPITPKPDDDEERLMPQRTTLDAMIPREDFARERDAKEQGLSGELIKDFPISYLSQGSPITKLLRKPDFQRETNHWTPEQIVTFIASFVDVEVIPSLILWKSTSFIFVIDGGHRLSALKAWMEDDYGDGVLSQAFYKGEIPSEQKKIAKRTRKLIEDHIGRFSTLEGLVGSDVATETQKHRANSLFTRALPVLWIQGSADVAETSFFKINKQGTALDETEERLIRNRNKPVAISARAILRAGAGHKYWSKFGRERQADVQGLASQFYNLVFEPEVEHPLRTLEVAIGGSVSPVDALTLLIEFLEIAGTREPRDPGAKGAEQYGKGAEQYADDEVGDETVKVLKNALAIINLITGNDSGSLGLHPAVYFYNDRGKYLRFLFLGMSLLLTECERNNDKGFFKRFTLQRAKLEKFLMENKSLLGILLQNMAKLKRIPKMRDLFKFLIQKFGEGQDVSIEEAIKHLELHGRIVDVVNAQASTDFTDETKSMIFVKKALGAALVCPICQGKLDPNKSVSYDHKTRVRDGGTGEPSNGDLVHPYCNTGFKS